MRILAVDTATISCSVGVLDAGRLMAEVTSEKKQTHSKHLMKMIDTVVHMAGIRMDEMDIFAATVGPGSFTGIRIGISTVQGFARALSKPVVGVSSLEALTHQAGSACPFLICPLLDARKGEVYAALYQSEKNGLRRIIEEHVSPLEKVLYRIEAPCLFVGSGAQVYGKLIGEKLGAHAMFAGEILGKIRAETVGRIAMQRIQTKDYENLNQLIPHYVRKSDAQISSG
jgi:tRNA threonylcarbamoyladenosine biosynthesis protein TsaB